MYTKPQKENRSGETLGMMRIYRTTTTTTTTNKNNNTDKNNKECTADTIGNLCISQPAHPKGHITKKKYPKQAKTSV
jgi:hypothetical protein